MRRFGKERNELKSLPFGASLNFFSFADTGIYCNFLTFSPNVLVSLSQSFHCGFFLADKSPADPLRKENQARGDLKKEKKKTWEQALATPDELSFYLAAPSSTRGEWSVRQSNLQVRRQTPFLSPSFTFLLLHALSLSVSCARSTCSERCGWAHTQLSLLCLSAVLLLHLFPSFLPPSLPSSIPVRLMNV